MSESGTYQQDGGVVTLTLNEPDTRNALSPAIADALVAHCSRINQDMSVSCVILTGAGESFSSGGNVKEMRDRTGLFGGIAAEIRRGYHHGIQKIRIAMYDIEVPAVAAVNGFAIGAGCDLSLGATSASRPTTRNSPKASCASGWSPAMAALGFCRESSVFRAPMK
jgi:enoyl-CoA hydratase/carnithine racemase